MKAAKCKIVKRKWIQKEARIMKFGGTAGDSAFIQLRNWAIFVIFISFFSSMLEFQQQTKQN